jgi:hypothetical protein
MKITFDVRYPMAMARLAIALACSIATLPSPAASASDEEKPGGVTPPGGNQGAPGSLVEGWAPDLVKNESRFTLAMLVKL